MERRAARVAAPRRSCSVQVQEPHAMQKLLIVLGALIVLAGLAWPWLSKLPLGRLPGDIVVDRPGFRFFMPITTMLIVSIVVSLIVWLFRR
jgi:Protein of unknown function (DUF2905)